MSVSFNANFATNQKVAFRGNQEKSNSFPSVDSTAKGAVAGGAAGAGITAVVKKTGNFAQSATDKVDFSRIKDIVKKDGTFFTKVKDAVILVADRTKELLTKSYGKSALAGAAVGAAALLVFHSVRRKKAEILAAENLKPIS